MSSGPSELRLLLQKYLYNNCTAGELDEFWHLMFELTDDDIVSEEIKKLWNDEKDDQAPKPDWTKMFERLQKEKNNHQPGKNQDMITGNKPSATRFAPFKTITTTIKLLFHQYQLYIKRATLTAN